MTTRRQAMGYVSFLSPFFLSCLIVLGMSIVPPFVIAETTTNMATVLEELSLFNPEAMERAIQDLASRYPDRFNEGQLLAELKDHADRLKDVNAALRNSDAAAFRSAQAIVNFKRRVLLSNPAVNFNQILCVKREKPGLAANWLVNTSISKTTASSIGILSFDGKFDPLLTSNHFAGDLNLHFDARKSLY